MKVSLKQAVNCSIRNRLLIKFIKRQLLMLLMQVQEI